MLATLCLAAAAASPAPAPQQPRDLAALLARGSAATRTILEHGQQHRLQVLLAEPVQRPDGSVGLLRSRLGDPNRYFYPASSIKLLGATAALLELNRINRDHGTAFGLDAIWGTVPRFPGDRPATPEPIRRDLARLFLVSDNLAFNKCWELVSPERMNAVAWAAGLSSCRLWHRLSERRTTTEQWQTRAVVLRQGAHEHEVPPREATPGFDNSAFAGLSLGEAYLQGGGRVEGPMSFDAKNAIALEDLQDALVAVVRPEIDTGKPGFPDLSLPQRRFLVEQLGMLPRESQDPRYDPAEYPDEYCKFVLPGLRRVVPAEHLRVYDKIGRAYGFSVENAYVEDTRTGAGFFLAVVLYTNPDGVLNDDRYAYEELADPFLAEVGELVARAVWARDGEAGGR